MGRAPLPVSCLPCLSTGRSSPYSPEAGARIRLVLLGTRGIPIAGLDTPAFTAARASRRRRRLPRYARIPGRSRPCGRRGSALMPAIVEKQLARSSAENLLRRDRGTRARTAAALPDRSYWPVSTVRNGYVANVGLSFRGP